MLVPIPAAERSGFAEPADPCQHSLVPDHPLARALVVVNLVGGLLVLASYAHGLATHSEVERAALWGGVPEAWRGIYSLSMLLATLGYFPMAAQLLWRDDPATLQLGPFGYGLVIAGFVLVLLPSALWMPLTFRMLAAPSLALWLGIRVVLALVAVGALSLVAALVWAGPRRGGWPHVAAIVGAIAFAWQTAVLDAVLWPAWFGHLRG